MAFVRRRRRKTGFFYYVVEYQPGGRLTVRSAGRDKAFARRWANRINELKLRRKAGFPDEENAPRCEWTIGDLKKRDLEDARQRGLVIYHRESCWRNILRVLPESLPLDQLTPEVIRDARTRWLATAGNVTANRYAQVFRFALRRARETPESGYRGDPFATIARLPEKEARSPRALTEREAGRLLQILRRIHPPTAATVELLLRTASRRSESGIARGRSLRFAAMKRGRPRSFKVNRELRPLLQSRELSRRAWRKAVTELGIPDLRVHDLRHTAATQAFLSGATVAQVQELLGHQSPQMAQRLYTHLFPRELEPVKYDWRPGSRPAKRPVW